MCKCAHVLLQTGAVSLEQDMRLMSKIEEGLVCASKPWYMEACLLLCAVPLEQAQWMMSVRVCVSLYVCVCMCVVVCM